MTGFQVFVPPAARRRATSATASVTLQRSGMLSLNQAAYDVLGRPAAVELLYDRKARTVGLRPVQPDVGHAYPVRRIGSRWAVSGRAFALHFDLDLSTSRQCPARVDGDVLCIDVALVPQEEQ